MGQHSKIAELKCLYANLQSFLNKKHEIEIRIASEAPDILFFTEIWYDDRYNSSENILENFQAPIISPNIRGGACAFVRNGLNFIPVEPPHKTSDSVWFTIKTLDNVNRLYACIYRSPNSNDDNNRRLINNISWASRNFSELILVGDFNLPTINWNLQNASTQYSDLFLDSIIENSLEQLINEPTRYRTGQNPSLLDLLITKHPDSVTGVTMNDPFGKSDHVSINFNFPFLVNC